MRLEVFREEGGYYIPETNKTSYIIETEKMKEQKYSLNPTGLKIDLFTEISKPVNKLAPLKSCNSLVYILAGLYKKQKQFDDCIIFNAEGNVAEAISSNVFIVAKNELFTPSLDQGCVAGVMREVIINFMRSMKKKVTECKITTNHLLAADEIFLTNVIEGIRWVGAIKNKRYFNNYSRKLFDELIAVQAKNV